MNQSLDLIKEWHVGATLGEGARWSSKRQILYCVDALRNQIIRLDPNADTWSHQELPGKILALGENDEGDLICGWGQTIAKVNQGSISTIAEFPGELSELEINDGNLAPCGRFYFGTRDASSDRPIAVLASFHPREGIIVRAKDYSVGNGIGWSPDQQFLYHIDTLNYVLYRYDYCEKTGELENRIVFSKFDPCLGKPDGMCVDQAGRLWIAIWDGGAIKVVSSTGQTLAYFSTPCSCPTSCAFGELNGTALFLTSASVGDRGTGSVYALRPPNL